MSSAGYASRILLIALSATLNQVCVAQQDGAGSRAQSELAPALSFEAPPSGTMPGGWRGGPLGTIFVDEKIVHGGKASARIERNSDNKSTFSTITKSIEVDFAGATVELRGFLRTQDASDFAGLWMREDGDASGLAFDNMQSRQLKETTPWTEYSIELPLNERAKQLFFGVLLAGSGKVWADDLQLLVDGRPVWELPKAERPKTVLDSDHEFDNGSRIAITALSPTQIDNLVMLGKVWGFLKYHYPAITSGKRHWDYDLFRILPAVLAASDHDSANAVLVRWIDSLGGVGFCSYCASLNDSDPQLQPDLGWIANVAALGHDLSDRLQSIRDNRLPNQQFYVSQVPNIGNPSFRNEPGYPSIKLPDSGFQLLALFRFWNIIEYWSPYRDITGSSWNSVLAQYIPRIALAKDGDTYKRELMALVAEAHDGHANLWGSINVRPPEGDCVLPTTVRFVERVPVVTQVQSGNADAVNLRIGDVITALDGVPIASLIHQWFPYYAASNGVAAMRDIARFMTSGKCGESEIALRRGDQELKFKVNRIPPPNSDLQLTHDLPGPAFRLLSKDVAYLKLSSVKVADCVKYVDQARGTKGLVIDIRNYPSEFVVFALGSLLVNRDTAFARFTTGDLSNPGAFHWTSPVSLSPSLPHYSGKIVILVDEVSISQAEYTAMALRSAPGAIVVGSTTSGADGNVSSFALPGGVQTMISGIGVFYPDKSPTQRIGIVPNIQVTPTIVGIRDGRDEVLEEALRQILGKDVPLAEIERITRPPRGN